jgi:hypothetical protein
MDATWIAIGAIGFASACALAAALGLRKAVADLRELVKWKNDNRVSDIERLQCDIAAMEQGLRQLGLAYKGRTTEPAGWFKKGD